MIEPTITITGPEFLAVLRIVDSCGGSKAVAESDDWNAGYDAALKAVERELKLALKRSWSAF